MQLTIRFWNGLAISAIAALAALLAFDLLAPVPTPAQRISVRMAADKRMRDQAYGLKKEFEEARQLVDSRVWKESPDIVGAKALERATAMAKAHGLKLSAFRPQKPIEEGELTRLAYVMTLEGPYPGLQAMIRELETPQSRLSVHLLQAASADEASDLVNATVGISAFVEKKRAPIAKDSVKNVQA